MLFDQGHLCLDGRGDIGRDKAGRPAADDHQVIVKPDRLSPWGIDFFCPDHFHDLFGNQRKNTQQDKRKYQAGGQYPAQGIDLPQPGPGIDINNGARQHADLGDKVEKAGEIGVRPMARLIMKKGKAGTRRRVNR